MIALRCPRPALPGLHQRGGTAAQDLPKAQSPPPKLQNMTADGRGWTLIGREILATKDRKDHKKGVLTEWTELTELAAPILRHPVTPCSLAFCAPCAVGPSRRPAISNRMERDCASEASRSNLEVQDARKTTQI